MMGLNAKDKRILVLAPHTDDGELGAGGAVARLLEEGAEVFYAVFSTCEESVPAGFPKDILGREQLAAAASLGVGEDRVTFFHYPVRKFPAFRQEILEDMVKLNRTIRPDLVFAPSLHDVHQDHHTVAEEALRAFKKTGILGYEEPWNDLSFDNQIYITLEERHVRAKARAVACYASQGIRDYTSEDYLRSLAHCHGIQIGKQYAEVFETVRWVL